jgi:hypothetical protein
MDKIDLDAILEKECWLLYTQGVATKETVGKAMKEAIHQAVVLASEKAHTNTENCVYADQAIVDKQSILDVEKLIV